MPTPPFVLRLREKVGHDLLWLPGVTAVVVREDRGRQEVLLVRRADDGRWTPVTGIVDPGEHPAVTAVREAQEETAVDCEVVGLVWVSVTGRVRYPNGDVSQYVDHCFRCRYLGGDARVNDDESSDVRWFAVDELPDLQPRQLERVRTALAWDGTVRLD